MTGTCLNRDIIHVNFVQAHPRQHNDTVPHRPDPEHQHISNLKTIPAAAALDIKIILGAHLASWPPDSSYRELLVRSSPELSQLPEYLYGPSKRHEISYKRQWSLLQSRSLLEHSEEGKITPWRIDS